MSRTVLRSLRLALASLLTVALVAQLAIGMSRSALTVVRFFSYFPVLANVMAVVLAVMLAARPGRDASPRFAVFRGAVTVYMAATGLVYALLNAPGSGNVGVHEPWIDWCIRVLGPIAVTLDWIAHPPPVQMPGESLWIWLLFPAAYLGYSLIRGPLVDWYPYPFLDPAQGGYGTVAMWSGVVLVVISSLGYACYWWADRRSAATATA
ncbi:MAG TPA: Pr6Pr family membrane protein [Acidimicrobiia bacterium]